MPTFPKRGGRLVGGVLATVCLGAALTACSNTGNAAADGRSINVLMVDNPQMVDLQKLTAANFTKQTGIKVNFTVLSENAVRRRITQDFSSQAGRYDVATISNFEVPFYAKNGWLDPMDGYLAADPGFDQNDILPTMRQSMTGADGKVYAEPFYGESSFLMYRKDVFAAEHLTMPAHPTWQQVADLAAKVDGERPGMRGICLRGQPGWGEMISPLTTVVNTFGGTWFTKDWHAQLDTGGFRKATEFYINLLRQHGETGAAQAGFTECLNGMEQGKVAMWYDATSAAGTLDQKGSLVAGKIGYAPAPVVETSSSGWLYTWAWGIQKASTHADDAWKFVSWASGKGYEKLVGHQLGWARIPAGKRASTYANPEYQKASAAFYKATRTAITTANPDDPGTQPRPTVGIQFVDIPEFTNLGDRVSQELSGAITGETSVDAALGRCQKLAAAVGQRYQ